MTGYFRRRRLRRRRIRPKRPPKLKTSQKIQKEVKIKKEKVSDEEMSNSSSSSESSFIGSSSSSSSESDDEAMDQMDCFGEEISSLLQSVPDLDLWVPKKRSNGLQHKSLLIYSAPSRKAKRSRTKKSKSRKVTFQFNTILKGVAYPPSTDIVTETVEDFLKEAEENGCEILQILEEDILKILIRNSRESERKRIQRLKQRQSSPFPGSDTDQHQDSSKPLPQSAVTRLYRASVDRKLLCAVTRWVGNVLFPLSTNCERRFTGRTRADEMNKKLRCVTITSTPIFTLLIQFFHIDAEGCLQMIRLQKVDEPEVSKKVTNTPKGTTKTTRNMADSDSKSPKSALVQSLNEQEPKPMIPQMTTEITPSPPPQKRRQSTPKSTPKTPKVRSALPSPKLKTVSELLREKRMQKSNAAKFVQRTAVLTGNILVPSQILIQQPASTTVQPQAMVLPVAPSTLQNSSWSVGPFSPIAACQAVTNNVVANPMSPVRGEPNRSLGTDPLESVPTPQRASPQANVQSGSSGVPPASQPLPHQVTLLPKKISPAPSHGAPPVTILITSQGLISIPTQALSCSNLTQQSGNQSLKVVSMPSNTSAAETLVTESSSGSISKTPSDTLHIPAQPLSATTSSKIQQITVTSTPMINFPPVSDTHLPMLAQSELSKKPSQILPAVTSYPCQDGTTLSVSLGGLSEATDSHLPTNAPTSEMPSLASTTIISSLGHKDMATPSLAASSPVVAGPFLPMHAPSHAAGISSQILPVTTSSLGQENTEIITSVESQSKQSGLFPAVAPTNGSNLTGNVLPVVTSVLKQVDTAAFSPAANCQKKVSSQLPILAPSKASTMLSEALPVTTSLGQEGTLVASSITSLPELDRTCSALAKELPSKASQLKLTPKKYPVVKIAKLLHTNYPKEDTANVTSDPQSSPVPNNTNQKSNSEKKNLDLKLISLEEEKSVKEWLLGKQGVQVTKQKIPIPYLPPSTCTLKTFSRLLLEKKTLEESALKLLPSSDITEVSTRQIQVTLSEMVEQKLKDNAAYQTVKQRFLSAFTIPGFLAVLPPTPVDINQESDEDFEDFMDCETNIVESTHKGNDADTQGDSVGNISEGTTPMLTEQERVFHNRTKDSNSVDHTERILTRRSIYCRPVT